MSGFPDLFSMQVNDVIAMGNRITCTVMAELLDVPITVYHTNMAEAQRPNPSTKDPLPAGYWGLVSPCQLRQIKNHFKQEQNMSDYQYRVTRKNETGTKQSSPLWFSKLLPSEQRLVRTSWSFYREAGPARLTIQNTSSSITIERGVLKPGEIVRRLYWLDDDSELQVADHLRTREYNAILMLLESRTEVRVGNLTYVSREETEVPTIEWPEEV